jgi:hypothetical protein
MGGVPKAPVPFRGEEVDQLVHALGCIVLLAGVPPGDLGRMTPGYYTPHRCEVGATDARMRSCQYRVFTRP